LADHQNYKKSIVWKMSKFYTKKERFKTRVFASGERGNEVGI